MLLQPMELCGIMGSDIHYIMGSNIHYIMGSNIHCIMGSNIHYIMGGNIHYMMGSNIHYIMGSNIHYILGSRTQPRQRVASYVSAAQGKSQLLPPAPPYYPFPRGKIHTRGNIWSFTVG